MDGGGSIPQGVTRWNRSVALERIVCEMKYLVLQATENPRANLPEFYDWAHDLRRGRTNILGGLFRLIDVMERRGMGYKGRMLAMQLIALAQDYVDLRFPATPPTPPAMAEPVPMGRLRLHKPIVAKGAVVSRRAA